MDKSYLLLVIFQIISWLLVIYLKSYITKKGENIATIEDTKKITDEIEQVKLHYGILQETDKVIKALVAERVSAYNTKKDNLLFDIYQEGNLLMQKLISLNSDKIEKDFLFEKFLTEINIEVGQYEMSNIMAIALFKDERLLNSINEISIPIYQLTSKLNEINTDLINKTSALSFEVVEDKYEFNNIEKSKEFLEYKYDLFIDYIKISYEIHKKYRNDRIHFIKEMVNYYESIGHPLNKT